MILAAAGFLCTARASTPLAMLAALAFGVANGGLGSSLWAGFAQAVSHRVRPEQGGVAFAVFVACSKLGLMLSALLLAETLHLLDYRSHGGALLLAMTGLPALGAIACLPIASIWKRQSQQASRPTDP